MAVWPYNTAKWQRLRRRKLQANTLCEVCILRGKLVMASHVDHRVSIASGGEAFPSLDELMSMCVSCHSTKTNARDNPHAFGNGDALAFKGCGSDGLPIDPDHPWNGGALDHQNGPIRDRRGKSKIR